MRDARLRRLPDDRVVHVEIVVDRRDDDFSRIDADAGRNRHALNAAYLFSIAGDRLLHPESCSTRVERHGPHGRAGRRTTP